ncbi:MAG: hypothetical protein Q4G16_02135 [Cruoricaptor ignavus]|nr:hypothetical protein [Cruoricaptor ignavus]
MKNDFVILSFYVYIWALVVIFKQMNVVKLIFQYLVGFFILLMSFSYFSMGGKSIIGAIICVICALIIIPLTREIMEKRMNLKFGKAFKYFVPFFGFFAPLFFINSDELSEIEKNDKSKTISDSIALQLDSISNDSSKIIAQNENRNILPVAGIVNTKNKFSENNKAKNNKLAKSNRKSNYTSSAKTAYKTNKSKRATRIKSTTTYQSVSGYCGHPNKTGGNCKRRVKGGGYCWQHS